MVVTTGVLNVLVLLIQWKGHGNRALVPRLDIEEMLSGTGIDDDTYPGGSLANFTDANSHGKLELRTTVLDYFVSDFTEQEIANGRSALPGGSGIQFHDAMIPILEQLDADGFDFSQFDANGDKTIDSIMVFHSGYAAETAQFDEDGTEDINRIISYSTGGSGFESSDGYRMGKYARASIFRGSQNQRMTRLGIMAHEFLHTLGLPDVYDFDLLGNRISTSSVGGLGAYDVMASPFGQNGRGATPGHLSPWTKIFLGWADPVDIKSDGVYTLRASELHNDYFTISTPYAEGEYLVIENRQPLLFDVDFYGEGGICIYKVDENIDPFPGGKNAGGTYQASWPGNGNHYAIALLQADGLYELEQGLNNGNEGDLWTTGKVLGPGNGETAHSNAVNYPNTDGYANGEIVVTGLTIDQFTEVEDGVWSFRVTGLGEGQAPAPFDPPTSAPGPPDDPAIDDPNSDAGHKVGSTSVYMSAFLLIMTYLSA